MRRIAAVAATAVLAVVLSGGVASASTPTSAWAIQSTPNPTGYAYTHLTAVSCPASSDCFAVGGWENANYTEEPTLIEQWNGTSWTIQSSPNPSGAAMSELTGVSCVSVDDCIAIGVSLNGGASWRRRLPSSGTGRAGRYCQRPTNRGLRTTSSPRSTVRHKTMHGGGVLRQHRRTAPRTPSVEPWNGTSWTIASTPNPAKAADTNLTAVSCSSATACTAVGAYYTASSASYLIAERWNGSTWAIQSTPNPRGGLSILNAVSCPSATTCIATGYYGERYALAEKWNGTSWKSQSIPNPSGSSDTLLYALSCVSANACTTVGYYSPHRAPSSHWPSSGTAQAGPSSPRPTRQAPVAMNC